jgi:hypothetical protein
MNVMNVTNVTNVTLSLSALLLLGGAVARAAPEKPAGTPASASAPATPQATAKVAGPPRPWKEMTPQERGKYMKEVVTPTMKAAFKQFDAHEFAKFGCETCHGDEPKARKFKMPNPDLPALPATAAGFGPLMEKKPKMMKFMGEVVKPQMAALLGLPALDPKKPEAGGFSCTACHTLKKE